MALLSPNLHASSVEFAIGPIACPIRRVALLLDCFTRLPADWFSLAWYAVRHHEDTLQDLPSLNSYGIGDFSLLFEGTQFLITQCDSRAEGIDKTC